MFIKIVSTVLIVSSLFYFSCRSGYKQEYQKAYTLLAKKDIDSIQKAVSKFDHAIRYAIAALQGKYEALLGLGAKYMELKMYSQATDVFLKASHIKSEDPSVYYFLGLSYANTAASILSQKEKDFFYNLAENAYKRGEKLDPDHLSLQYALGIFYGLIKNDPSRGLSHLQKVLKKSPLHIDSLFASGRLYMQLEKWSEAWSCYEKLEKSYPSTDFSRKAKENLEKIRGFLR